MTDVMDAGLGLDDTDDDLDGDHVDPPADGEQRTELSVCDVVGPDGALCGATFDNPTSLKRHAWAKHRDRSKDKQRSDAGKSKPSPSKPTGRKAPAKKATTAATGPSTSRTATYASSLSMAALGAYLAIPKFDKVDLDIVNGGATNLAGALDALGSENPAVRRTCDLVLGGGAGGSYLQLLLAVSAIAVPIAAHHGMVPNSAGQRFGEMSGVSIPAAPASPPDTETPLGATQASGSWDPSTMTSEDLVAFMSQVPETTMFDLASKMMPGMGPTVVAVPDMTAATHAQPESEHDGERGSEQLRPVDPNAPVPPDLAAFP